MTVSGATQVDMAYTCYMAHSIASAIVYVTSPASPFTYKTGRKKIMILESHQ